MAADIENYSNGTHVQVPVQMPTHKVQYVMRHKNKKNLMAEAAVHSGRDGAVY